MKSLKTLILSAAAIAALGSPALAGPVVGQRSYPMAAAQPGPQAALAQLRDASDEVSHLRTMPLVKGPVQVRYMERQSELDSLIERLGAGAHVSADELDRALAG
jgi:hypothetical protein